MRDLFLLAIRVNSLNTARTQKLRMNAELLTWCKIAIGY